MVGPETDRPTDRVLAYEPASCVERRPYPFGRTAVFACAVLVVCTFLWTYASNTVKTPSVASLNRCTANVVLSALNQYAKENGRYPQTMAELRPMYLLDLPPSANRRGTTWSYQVTVEGEGFKLGWKCVNDACTIDQSDRVQESTNPGGF